MNYQELWDRADAFYQGTSQSFRRPINGHDYRMRDKIPDESAWRRVIHRKIAPLMWAWLEQGHRPPMTLFKRVQDTSIATLMLQYISRTDLHDYYYAMLNMARDRARPVSEYNQEPEWYAWLADKMLSGDLSWDREHVETREQLLKQQPWLWRFFDYDDKVFFLSMLENKSREEQIWWLEHHHKHAPPHVLREWVRFCQENAFSLSEATAQSLLPYINRSNADSPLMVTLWKTYGSLREDLSTRVISLTLLQQSDTWEPWDSLLERSSIPMLAKVLPLCKKNSDVAEKMWAILAIKTERPHLKEFYEEQCQMCRYLGERPPLLLDIIKQYTDPIKSEITLIL